MLKEHRWNAARTRTGSLVAAALVGSGLLLTASNGFAAETTKKVEARMRTVLAPVIAPPEAPEAPMVPEAPAAMTEVAYVDGQPPVPPTPPVPPAYAPRPLPPVPPAPAYRGYGDREARAEIHQAQREAAQAQREAQQAAREAQQEAAQSAREAQQEAAQSAREAQMEAQQAARDAEADMREHAAELRMAQREAMRARPIMVSQTCSENVPVKMTARGDRQVMIRCTNFQPVDQAQLRRTIIASLENAKRSVVASMDDDWGRRARTEALAGIDREIARLKAEQR